MIRNKDTWCARAGQKGPEVTTKEALSNSERDLTKKLAVREGFEPSMPFDIHAFQACSFDHSDTSPN